MMALTCYRRINSVSNPYPYRSGRRFRIVSSAYMIVKPNETYFQPNCVPLIPHLPSTEAQQTCAHPRYLGPTVFFPESDHFPIFGNGLDSQPQALHFLDKDTE